ncbi:response regulator transcription factor [Sulfurovum sp. bin170]|uniref:response regulator transcription factor n=1 Tax=Sulfurovum sp. bin170 TaxID=2695268 RepID=UPI0013DE90FB|nr:winged helix-turn-helix domain-containing protein [Sulfurovum sp. bin170]NEW60575.1 response regulator transcription factor [Sulfurovum sp. bin170]
MKKLENLTMLYIDFDNDERDKYLKVFRNYFKKVLVTSEDGFRIYNEEKPDIIIIELETPQSVELVKKIREKDDKIGLMALTNNSSIALLREIVELSFSSYLIKPVSDRQIEDELKKVSKKIDSIGKILLPLFCQWDIKSKTLFYKESVLFLTKRESTLFKLLVEKRGKFSTDDEILFAVWGDEFDKSITNSSIRTLVKNLRKKVPNGLIENQYGVGYKISE